MLEADRVTSQVERGQALNSSCLRVNLDYDNMCQRRESKHQLGSLGLGVEAVGWHARY